MDDYLTVLFFQMFQTDKNTNNCNQLPMSSTDWLYSIISKQEKCLESIYEGISDNTNTSKNKFSSSENKNCLTSADEIDRHVKSFQHTGLDKRERDRFLSLHCETIFFLFS